MTILPLTESAPAPAGACRGRPSSTGIPNIYRPTIHGPFYGNFRQYADVGGDRMVLTDPATGQPVVDLNHATQVYAIRADAFAAERERHRIQKLTPNPRFADAIREVLVAKTLKGDATPSTIDTQADGLLAMLRVLGNIPMSGITAAKLDQYVVDRAAMPGARRGQHISHRTIRRELFALADVFRWLRAWGLVDASPIDEMTMAPAAEQGTEDDVASYLQRFEIGLLLDAAACIDRETQAAREEIARYENCRGSLSPSARPSQATYNIARRYPDYELLFATFAYTGGRHQEVTGLCVEELDLAHAVVRFRRNEFRSLKKKHHKRNVTLWPAYERYVLPYLERSGLTSGLVLPSEVTGGMLTGVNAMFDRCLLRSGIEVGARHLVPHSLRHSYATYLAQTVVFDERGERVIRSVHSVSRALGHRSTPLTERVYMHDTDDLEYTTELNFEGTRRVRSGSAPSALTVASSPLRLLA